MFDEYPYCSGVFDSESFVFSNAKFTIGAINVCGHFLQRKRFLFALMKINYLFYFDLISLTNYNKCSMKTHDISGEKKNLNHFNE